MEKLKKLRVSKELGDVNLYRKDKFDFVFRKVGLSGERVKSDSSFQQTLQKAAAFAAASHMAKLIYEAIQPYFGKWKKNNCYRRILQRILPSPNDLSVLNDFQCNPRAYTLWYLFNHSKLAVLNDQNRITAILQPLEAIKEINFPIGSTWFKVGLILITINTETGEIQKAVYDEPVFYRFTTLLTKPVEISLERKFWKNVLTLVLIEVKFYHSSESELFSFEQGKWDWLAIRMIK